MESEICFDNLCSWNVPLTSPAVRSKLANDRNCHTSGSVPRFAQCLVIVKDWVSTLNRYSCARHRLLEQASVAHRIICSKAFLGLCHSLKLLILISSSFSFSLSGVTHMSWSEWYHPLIKLPLLHSYYAFHQNFLCTYSHFYINSSENPY